MLGGQAGPKQEVFSRGIWWGRPGAGRTSLRWQLEPYLTGKRELTGRDGERASWQRAEQGRVQQGGRDS